MIKKFFISLILALTAVTAVSTMTSQPVHAAAECREVIGLKSWDCGIDIKAIDSQGDLKSSIWAIAANILIDITVIAAYLVIGYTIYGGYQYIMSSGDPNKVASGKKTLANAFLGLAIVMLANVILNSIRIALGVNLSQNCATTQCIDPGTMITNAIQWVIGVSGFVAAIFVVYGGITYMTSAGEPGKLQKAKQMITYALIGLAIVALSEVIVTFVTNMINEAKNSSQINTTSISKEITK